MTQTGKRQRRKFGRIRQFNSGRWQASYTGPDGRVYIAPKPSTPRSTPKHGSPTAAAKSTDNYGPRHRVRKTAPEPHSVSTPKDG